MRGADMVGDDDCSFVNDGERGGIVGWDDGLVDQGGDGADEW